MRSRNDYAVSPVVGVMLMLVVTIIIAAIVSAFAGGMGSSQKTAPQVTFKAEYSVTDGMKIYHNGGDTLSIGDFQILLTPSRNFDSIESDSYVSVIDPKLISNGPMPADANNKMWYDAKGGRQVPRFAAGDTAYINATNCNTNLLTPSLIYDPPGPSIVNNGINQTSKIGATFFLDFVTLDGKKITRIEVPITG
jgi:archaeal type IV pilus assembly protein PilA